jgi:Ca2+-binding RTX toxin-like protein
MEIIMPHTSFGFQLLFGSNSIDTLIGNSSDSFIFGFGGNDTLKGLGGNDVIAGGAGNDMVSGGAGQDRLYGGQGDDMVTGGSGADRIFGGKGNDTIEGGTGKDVLAGGEGADRFVFNPDRDNEGRDRITDFKLGEDKIVLSVAAVLASTPGLLELSGDPAAFEPTDLDASDLWNLGASHDGDLVVYHPTGSIELDGVKFAEGLTFSDILPAIDLIA